MPPSPRTILALLIAVIVVAGCASGPAEQAGPTAPLPPTPAADPDAAGGSFSGELGGNAGLEGGCIWLDTGDQRYELRLPEGYTADLDALEITTPGGSALAVGDALTVTGVVREDLATICQVGPVIEVEELSGG